MRLTLRTMLAYMDGILEPEDAEDIGKKIEESEFATSLLHRTRDVIRRLRLGAPGLSEHGPGLDANTVAEYLDNTLHGDRVPDFEKVCLDSDVHLAEVASCHQILTLVLGEPAEIDPAGRQRMYQLPAVAAARAEGAGRSQPAAPRFGDGESKSEPSTPKTRHKPTVPDYLREPPKRRRLLPAAGVVAAAVCLAVIVLIAVGQFERGTFLGNLLFGAPESSETEIVSGSDSDARSPAQPPFDAGASVEPQSGAPSSLPPSAVDPSAAPVPPEDGSDTVPAAPAAPQDPAGTGPSATAPPAEAVADEPSGPPILPTKAAPEADSTTAPAADPTAKPSVDRPAEPGDELPREAVVGEAPKEADKLEPAAAPPQRMGELMLADQVLLRFDAESDSWERVPARGIVSSRQRLLALPTYRPLIALSTGVTIQLVGGTWLELLRGDNRGIPGLSVNYGRLVIRTTGKEQARLRLQLGNRSGVITFNDPESIAALEVTPIRVPGTNPETGPPPLEAYLYAKTGQILWQQGNGQPVPIAGNIRLKLAGQPAEELVVVQEFPEWISKDTVAKVDSWASTTLEKQLAVGRSARLGLRELTSDRKKEVRWLAVRCLGYVGWFHPMVAVLNKPEYRLEWPDYVEKLLEAVARGPEEAAAIRRAMEKQYGEEAAELYRMLWGYTPGQLRSREAAKLVEHLEHKTLAFRVLSFWNLKGITGWGLLYKPEYTAAKRQQPIQRWKQRLKSGEIWSKLSGERPRSGGQKAPAPAG